MRRLVALLPLVLVVACAGGSGPGESCRVGAAGRYAPFRPGDSIGSIASTLDTRHTYSAWLRVDAPSQLRRVDGGVRLTDAVRLGGSLLKPPDVVHLSGREAGEARAELSDGASVVFVAGASGYTAATASLRSDGTLALLGGCHRWHMRTLRRFAARRAAAGDPRSPADLFAALPKDRALVAELAETEAHPDGGGPTFAEVRPERRYVPGYGTARAPDSALATLTRRTVRVDHPAGWEGFEGYWGLFVPGLGWQQDLVAFESGDTAVTAWTAPGRPLELWVANPVDLERPFVRLATVTAEQLRGGSGQVVLRAVAAAIDLNDLMTKAANGERLYAVAAGR